jgi:hypothetical protein
MKRCLVFALCLLIPSSAALADGDGPTRRMTGPEAAAFDALKGGFQAALPRTPANYSLSVSFGSAAGEFEVPEAIKPGQMVRMSFSATYTLSRDFQAGQASASFMDRAKGTPEQQARLAALEAKEAELARARDATRDRGEKDRIRAERKAVSDEANKLSDRIVADYQAWVASGGATAAMQDADRALPPKELTVRALINQDVSLIDKAAPFKLAGFPLAFEQSEGCQDVGATCITVFLGTFDKEKRISTHTRYNLRNANLGVATKARGMAIVVGGPKDKAQDVRDFLKQVDLAKLKSLLP